MTLDGADGPRLDLTQHLAALLPTGIERDSLRTSVLPSIITAIRDISQTLRSAHTVALAGSSNPFGDDQLNVDVAAEDILRAALSQCPAVVSASSEEDPIERPSGGQAASNGPEAYAIAFDPLDGSSIIAPNWCVGSIVGVWDGPSPVGLNPRTKQIAAILGVYGPRATAIVALRVPGVPSTCFEISLDPARPESRDLIRQAIRLDDPPFQARYFAPANLRMAGEDARYASLISRYINERYNLRYCGGLVPDIVHALVKGHGIYVSPVTTTSKAKLRRLYELFPLALIVECAGGQAIDPSSGTQILDQTLRDLDERGGLVCGTSCEVEAVRTAFAHSD